MLSSIRRKLAGLKGNTSGNATLLVALGMPILIGGSGLAVDTAQWYTWKRELQFAVDQAALAGAWARSNDTSRSTYATRARQEFTANLATTSTIAATPTVTLASYNSGSQNSVVVSASAARRLPFSSMLTGHTTTVAVYAQASYTAGLSFTACLIGLATTGVDLTFGGSSTLGGRCGLAALSTSPNSIVINGNPTLDPGWVVSAGGIDSWLAQHTSAEIHEYMAGLSDPFASLTTPVPVPNPTQTYNCVAGTTTTKGDKRSKNDTAYTYWKGSNTNSVTSTTYTGTGSHTNVTGTYTAWAINLTLANGTVNGTVTTVGTPVWIKVSGSGANSIWEKAITTGYVGYQNVVANTTQTQATLSQGTYTGGFDASCTTVMNAGIYVINGGRVKVTGQYQVTGSGVLFVLKNGAFIDIAGGSAISLTAPTSAQLQLTGGISATQAAQFAGMLVYEDRASPGTTNSNKLNGNSATTLNGKIYLPNSDITFSGTAQVTTACLLIAANRITLTGTTNMSSFCPPGSQETDQVSQGVTTVKLVA